jgi:hypothetical protein
MALLIGRAMAWRKITAEAGLEKLWDRVGYATRYSSATLSEVLNLDQLALQEFIDALSRIVREENKPSR